MARNKSFNAAEDLNFGVLPVTASKEKITKSSELPAESKSAEKNRELPVTNNSDLVIDKTEKKVLKKEAEEKTVVQLNDREQNFDQTLHTLSLFQKSKKENRSIKKTILIKQSTHNKLKKIADEVGTSMNDVINEILEQMLKDM